MSHVLFFVLICTFAIKINGLPASCSDEQPPQPYPMSNGLQRERCSLTPDTRPQTRQGVSDKKVKWPLNTMIYEWSDSNTFTECQKDLILEAMATITKSTNGCIKFSERIDQDDYVVIGNAEEGCFTLQLGNAGGAQTLNLDKYCFLTQYTDDDNNFGWSTGTPVHEILHAIGFQHEHQRPDRDDYIQVYFKNIAKKDWVNFNKKDVPQVILGPYDFQSIMHYASTDFSNNTKPSMLAIKNKSQILGKADKLTQGDVKKLLKYYNCRK